jgi:tRNA dimethylallyltransferase
VTRLALVGCTATGKSTLAIALAQARGDVEIVTADSMQVYRGMDIGTAKPSRNERDQIPHHLVDVADPGEEFSVTRFQQAVADAVAGIESRGNVPVLVGGTGLYLRAVIDDLDVPGQWPAVRTDLEREPDTRALHARLASLDPVSAGRMEPDNRRRVVRALEVTVGSGRPFSSFGPGLATYPRTTWRQAAIRLPRPVLRARIRARFDTMVAAGFVDEVRALAVRPLSRTARQALGYREVLAHLEGVCTLADALDAAVRRTIAFARRQDVWFRRDPRVHWIDAEHDPAEARNALVEWASACEP